MDAISLYVRNFKEEILRVFVKYLYDELWTGDVELLWAQDSLLTGSILHNNCKVDQVIPHHVFILC